MGFTKSITVDWDYLRQNGFIEDRGTNVIHELGIACTCRTMDPFDQKIRLDLSCDKCEGFGFLYRKPQEINGLVTSVDQNRSLMVSGFATPGDCLFSPSPKDDHVVSDFDKITFTHEQPINDGQTIVRGAATRGGSRVTYTGLEPHEDRLFYEATKALHCEDEHGTVYYQGSDFELKGRVVSWNTDKMLPDTRYTLKYMGHLEWIAYVGPFERRDRGDNLGQRVLLRKRHIATFLNYDLKVTAENKVALGTSELLNDTVV